MRYTISAPLLLLALATGCSPQAPVLDQAHQAELSNEVNRAVTGFVSALNAHDPDAILAFYSLDQQLGRVACTALVVGGKDTENRVRSSHTQNKDVIFEMVPLHTRVLSPEVALVVVSGRATGVPGLTWTLGMVKGSEGGWQIVHEHQSWPDCDPAPRGHSGADGSPEMTPGMDAEMDDPGA